MVRSILRCCNRRLAIIVILFTSAVMASDAPPAMLPQGFLEQLTLLMQLSEQEFEVLLNYADADANTKRHNNEVPLNTPADGNRGEQNEN
ncbi:MAG: hypothetical protein ACC707_12455 [Thiohalomonadales bacterium]